METIIASFVSGTLLLAGTVYTVHRSRRASTQQHEQQTEQLHMIQTNQRLMMDTIQAHRSFTETKLDRLDLRVDKLSDNQDLLFNMVAEVDSKVTKPAKKRIAVNEDVS